LFPLIFTPFSNPYFFVTVRLFFSSGPLSLFIIWPHKLTRDEHKETVSFASVSLPHLGCSRLLNFPPFGLYTATPFCGLGRPTPFWVARPPQLSPVFSFTVEPFWFEPMTSPGAQSFSRPFGPLPSLTYLQSPRLFFLVACWPPPSPPHLILSLFTFF